MKRKRLIISVVFVLVIILSLVILLSEDNRDRVQQKAFISFNRISCISVNQSEADQESLINAYSTPKTVLVGHTYDGSDPKKFIYSLIESRVINTFLHSSADVCLTSFRENDSTISLEYKVRQIYYTSMKNIEKYTFLVEIDKTDKSITITNTDN